MPRNEAALNTLLDVVRDEVCRPLFPLCWKKDHFGFDPKDFYRTVPSFTEEEIDAHQKIWAFVQFFSQKIKTDKRGNPLMNADGTPVTEPRFINSHDLVVSEDPNDCLGSYIYFCLACSCLHSFVSDLFFHFFCVCRKNEEFTGTCK